MKARRLAIAAAVVAAIVAFPLGRAAFFRPYALAGDPPAADLRRVVGVVHVHTTLSDGGGTPEEVIGAAQAAGLDFVVLTDHNNADAKRYEGYHGGVLVIVGSEISTTAGHVLGLGIEAPTFRFSGGVEDAFADVRDLGGVAFAAHPTSPRADFRWTGWDQPGPWGIEVLNGDSQWREAGGSRLAKTLAYYPANPVYALLTSLTPPDETLAEWDARLAERAVPAMAGADAHSRVPIRKQQSVRFPSYEALFRCVRNHVRLASAKTGEAKADARAIVDSLAAGRSYVGVDGLAPADGFRFEAVAPDGPRGAFGDVVAPADGLRLVAGGALPAEAAVALRRDGKVLETGAAIDHPVKDEGVYRVEVRLPGWKVPWIVSNPIYVFGEERAAARAARGAWPAPVEAPPAATVLDTFDGPTTPFHAEADPSSAMEPPHLDPGQGPRGSLRFPFRLGASGPGRPYTWCAMVDRSSRDLSGGKGLVFSIRGDGTYRTWVQVRDANPASADEGTEWWFGSVKATPEWRRVTVPFAALRSLNKNTDGRLDLDRVRGIFFIIDEGAMPAGAHGTIWIDELGVY